ncbi:class I SAM-dependent methyltransferase [Paraburkholderia diazotrophica]|uniref:Methyltransferase domain-containing protein n=1 Tax=Paraburkholderia diazotrophica TaxID=667676 RepID=A0A1H7CSQ2_9BURK|nr:class I SAM-dependent methyltransferase [Paraburkholderia diazotrophica]SEJ92611.1 Methyltransferase domain-containing protein [Paraburkholderia diazotrophica]
MSFFRCVLLRAFGRPQGALGRIGGRIMANMNAPCAAWAIDLLDVRASDRVIEIGFGPGVGIQLLAQKATAGKIAGVDPSPEMLAQAAARNTQAIARGQVDLRQGSAERLPFDDDIFDKALAVNSMQVWPDAAAGLAELRRVMKPGATLALAFTIHSGQQQSGLLERVTGARFADAKLTQKDGDAFCVTARA